MKRIPEPLVPMEIYTTGQGLSTDFFRIISVRSPLVLLPGPVRELLQNLPVGRIIPLSFQAAVSILTSSAFQRPGPDSEPGKIAGREDS
jgi:hypothetical protein